MQATSSGNGMTPLRAIRQARGLRAVDVASAAQVSLQTGQASGLLCGAWGFAFCLNYRALFWRVEVLFNGGGSPVLETMTWILAVLLVISMAAFLASLHLCNPRRAAA